MVPGILRKTDALSAFRDLLCEGFVNGGPTLVVWLPSEHAEDASIRGG